MTSQNDDPAVRVLKDYAAAVLAKDLDAFTSLYDRDVFVFDAWNIWSHKGNDAWRALASDWFTSLGTERVLVEFEDVRSRTSPSLAYVSAAVRFTALSTAGDKLRSVQNRLTMVLELRDGVWKVVHQHTSLPIDFSAKSDSPQAK